MKATFDGQNYLLILDRATQEFERLQQERLEAPLTKPSWGGGRDLGKVVSLEVAENDGIELNYLPGGANLETAKVVQVKINEGAYNNIRGIGSVWTRPSDFNKITIINGAN